MTTTIKRLAAATTGLLALSLATTLLVAAAPAQALRQPWGRNVSAPNVFFPVSVREARYLPAVGHRPGAEIKAKCGKAVFAATPGTAVVTSSEHSGPALVKIVTSAGRLTTFYGYMRSATVTTGQIVQAGQTIGLVGKQGDARRCSLYFAIKNNKGKTVNPVKWLHRRVGKPVPTSRLFDNPGFVVASLNVLGASHTKKSRTYAPYDVRTPKQLALLNAYGVDVAGLQEFQPKQRAQFAAIAGSSFGIYPTDAMLAADSSTDTDNSIIWRTSKMEFISGETVDVPYFLGWSRPRKMPVVLLRDRATGRTAYFFNVHNPASGVSWGDQTANRRAAIAVERAKIIELRATGRPVFLTGDFNDRKAAFCPLTAGMLTLTPDSIPSMTCAPPSKLGIDWIFAAGPTRFTRYNRDWKPKDLRLTDHPIVWTRAHLSE